MPTSVPLDPLASARVKALKLALAKEFGIDTSEREIVGASVYGTTAAHLVGMLFEFTKAKSDRDGGAGGAA